MVIQLPMQLALERLLEGWVITPLAGAVLVLARYLQFPPTLVIPVAQLLTRQLMVRQRRLSVRPQPWLIANKQDVRHQAREDSASLASFKQ